MQTSITSSDEPEDPLAEYDRKITELETAAAIAGVDMEEEVSALRLWQAKRKLGIGES